MGRDLLYGSLHAEVEGMDQLMQLANLSTLWAEAQVYTTQMPLMYKSENATVQIPDMNNESINGSIDFINPEINPDTRITLMRVTIPNKNNQLHPGMPVLSPSATSNIMG